MEAPLKGLSSEAFVAAIRTYLEVQCVKTDDDRYRCAKCGNEIKIAPLTVSIHLNMFGNSCSGFGETHRIPLPYCERCEGKPATTSTCVHIPMKPAFTGLDIPLLPSSR